MLNDKDKMLIKKILDKEFEVMSLSIKKLIEKAQCELIDKINFELSLEYCKKRNLINL